MSEFPHALVVPASGQGHVNACMLLARSLAAVGFKVTFVYFSSCYARLKGPKPLAVPGRVRQEEGIIDSFNRSAGDGGGEAESMIRFHVVEDAITKDDINNIWVVTPAMKENLFNFILELKEQGVPPTCLISDSFIPFTLHVAERAGIPRIDFWTANAMSYLFIINLPTLFSLGIFPEKGSPTLWKSKTPLMLNHIPGLPPFSSELHIREARFTDPSSPVLLLFMEMSSCVKSGERILIHTISDLEPDAFRAFQVAGLPVYAIGPLLPYAEKKEDTPAPSQLAPKESGPTGVSQSNEQKDCISWLNMQAESSVIYIAFGSFAGLSVEDIQELAMGLEASGNPFLWVIRENSRGGLGLAQLLPDGFLERTSAKGMIISWAPQLEVLAHKAIGGFLTHCGWNSTLESLWAGVPMLCCPLFAEQRLNTHYICNVWGLGLELGRTDTGGLERSFVELGVKALMQDKEGFKHQGFMHLARKTCAQGGQSFNNLQKFYDDMKILCSLKTSISQVV